MARRSALLLVALLATNAAAKKRKYHVQKPWVDVSTTAAWHYGSLSKTDCLAELDNRHIAYEVEDAKGVEAPVRLTGPLHGITYHTRDKADESSIWEIADCRLVLALDDFGEVLQSHDVIEVLHYSMHRAAPKSWADDRVGIQHIGGMAIDAAIFVQSDGTRLSVLDDFHGRIGAKTCGEGARPRVKNEKSTAIREILCEGAAKRLFNVILTPNHNRPHRNHFHLEVTVGAKWFLVD